MKRKEIVAILVVALCLMVWLAGGAAGAAPMGTAWTYQGRLMDANGPADGVYDFEFKLWMDPCEIVYPPQVGDTLTMNDLDVIDGYFTVELDFNSPFAFNGHARWLEILVRPGDSNDVNDYVTLSPRQEVTPTPYALQTRGIFVDENMNIGMGTTSPKSKLHVDGGKAADDTDAGDITIKAQEGGDAVHGFIGGHGGNIILLPGEGGESPGYTPPGLSGNVGIGTASPEAMLDVSGDVNYSGQLTKLDVADNFLATVGAADFMLGHSSRRGSPGRALVDFNDALVLNFEGDWDRTDIHGATTYITGNVGIGTVSPAAKLEIEGDGTNIPLDIDAKGLPDFGKGIRITNTGMLDGTNMNINLGKADLPGQTAEIVYYHASDMNDKNLLSLGFWGQKVVNIGLDGKVGIGTTGPGSKLTVHDSTSGATIWAQNDGDGYGLYSHCDDGDGVWGHSVSGIGLNGYSVYSYGVCGYSMDSYGVYGSSGISYAGYFDGDVYVKNDVSALTFTDRTPYPPDLATAYQAVMSMERLPDGQYDENNKEAQLDHSMLSDFIRSQDGNRDLSATVSCHNEVLKDLIRKQQELGKAHIYIEQLQKQNQLLEARLVKLEAMIARQAGR
jgi:hypothetical protein